ncbi:hypothetical protein BC941DRAFT_450335 [Chlamydoabsidia padenii]|nr:hypothetical protein BC941DRAFT_450335 [Chlamydoabsidia padenii]
MVAPIECYQIFPPFDRAPRLTSLSLKSNESSCEGTFVLHYLDDVLEGVFSQEPLLQQEWTNGWLTTSKEEKSTKALKPDWVAFVKPWINKIDLAACEVKPPNKSVSFL